MFGFGIVGFVEEEATVDATVGSLLDAFGGSRPTEPERPVLELVLVFEGKLLGPSYVRGLADDLVGLADVRPVGVVQTRLDKADGEVGDVDSDPAAVQLLGARRRCASS